MEVIRSLLEFFISSFRPRHWFDVGGLTMFIWVRIRCTMSISSPHNMPFQWVPKRALIFLYIVDCDLSRVYYGILYGSA